MPSASAFALSSIAADFGQAAFIIAETTQIPAIGIPHAYDCYESRAFRRLLDTDGLEIYLLYDSLRIRKKWIEHLDWLNESLDVKTIKRKDFELWISQH